MKHAYDILNHYADLAGWDDNSVLILACEYIDRQQDAPAFEEHVKRAYEDECREAECQAAAISVADIEVIDPIECPRCGRKYSGNQPECLDCRTAP